MGRQFLREWSLTAGGITVGPSDLRVVFSVKSEVFGTPPNASVRLYNVSPNTGNSIFAAATAKKNMAFAAGYKDASGVIFNGPIIQCNLGKENATDTYCNVYGQAADNAHNFAHVSTTLKAGSSGMDVFNTLLKTMPGLQQGRIPTDALQQLKYPRAVVLSGMSRHFMRTLAQTIGASFHYDPVNPLLHMTKPGDQGTGPAIVLDGDHGMIGLPTQTTAGVVVRALLNPQIQPGSIVHINPSSIQKITPFFTTADQPKNTGENSLFVAGIDPAGDYKVAGVQFIGDSRGESWVAEVNCFSVTKGATAQQVQTFPNAPANAAKGPDIGVN